MLGASLSPKFPQIYPNLPQISQTFPEFPPISSIPRIYHYFPCKTSGKIISRSPGIILALELFCIVGRWHGGREYQCWDTLWCLGMAMHLGVHAVCRYFETFKCHSQVSLWGGGTLLTSLVVVWWLMAVGGWWLSVGSWRQLAIDGSWRLSVGS